MGSGRFPSPVALAERPRPARRADRRLRARRTRRCPPHRHRVRAPARAHERVRCDRLRLPSRRVPTELGPARGAARGRGTRTVVPRVRDRAGRAGGGRAHGLGRRPLDDDRGQAGRDAAAACSIRRRPTRWSSTRTRPSSSASRSGRSSPSTPTAPTRTTRAANRRAARCCICGSSGSCGPPRSSSSRPSRSCRRACSPRTATTCSGCPTRWSVCGPARAASSRAAKGRQPARRAGNAGSRPAPGPAAGHHHDERRAVGARPAGDRGRRGRARARRSGPGPLGLDRRPRRAVIARHRHDPA